MNKQSYTFSSINDISISVKRSNITLVFFKATCHANPRAERKFAGSSSHFLKHIFLKFSNTTANDNVFLSTYKS